jgi:hypothetical protein
MPETLQRFRRLAPFVDRAVAQEAPLADQPEEALQEVQAQALVEEGQPEEALVEVLLEDLEAAQVLGALQEEEPVEAQLEDLEEGLEVAVHQEVGLVEVP